ncbi:MAG: MurR/RpiR family transcriptional regulator [Bacilli bacterium]|nr:MurR/RpiR family transcriptional regulator [Bacilli bacterium]
MEGKVIEKIAGFKTSATKKEKILIDRLKELDGNVIIHMSITELANKIDIAEATILRFCKKIGYKGYQDFKIALSQDVAFRKVEMNNSLIEKSFNKITSGLEFTINNLDSSMIKEVTKSILHAKKICVFGIGNSYVPTMYFYNALVKKGVNIWVSSDSHIRNMLAVNLTKDDFVILLSSSGKTTEMINLAKICKKTNTPIAVITNQSTSELASYASYLFLSSTKDNEYNGGEASSIVSQTFILDVLVQNILKK